MKHTQWSKRELFKGWASKRALLNSFKREFNHTMFNFISNLSRTKVTFYFHS